MSEQYDQKAIEKKWQKKWQEMKIYHFDFDSNKKPYSIDVPPRYASGPLHAGHAVHYTHIDFAARYKRMQGYNVFFPLCFDVNGIPIEERVERQLNITRKDIDRHKFTKLCSEFAEKNIKTMTDQFIMLGESMDPSIYYQTNAEYYRRLTQISFIELYNKGYIYKGKFPVNWCPRCMTAMADAEVIYADRTTKLNTIKFYFIEQQSEQLLKYHSIGKDEKGMYVEIATTRPEMLPSCQIVAVHPSDERTLQLTDQTLKVPLFKKEVKIVADDAVDPEFGSGIVMVCTIGDKEDLNWVFKYKLPLEMSIDEEGRMTDICDKYKGMKIEEARRAVIDDLKKNNILIKQEPLEQSVGVCWRCKTPIEFINAKQWFLKTIPFKEMVLKASDKMNWYPEFMKIRLEDWVNSLEWDWVISRQRYFATPIPLWECENCGHVALAKPEDCYVDPTIDESPIDKCPKCSGAMKGCEDVFDTWMDSSISPLYNTFWHRDDKKFKKMYPMSLRPQAHDIIRTWAFYTILRCILLTDKEPFENIMMGGFILSEDGTPMHASLGNVIDPLKIIDEYGTDAFRCYAASCALGEDNSFRQKEIVRGTRLLRKLWNVQRFIMNIIKNEKPSKCQLRPMDKWILSKYSRLVKQCTDSMDKFEYSSAIKEIEYFLWHELADHYVEMVKPFMYEKKNIESIQYTLYVIGLGITKLFAPFFPDVTEEIYYNQYKQFEEQESIHITSWPEPLFVDEKAEKTGEFVKNIISAIRNWKSKKGIPLNQEIRSAEIFTKNKSALQETLEDIMKTLNIKQLKLEKSTSDLREDISNIKPVYASIGKKFRKKVKHIIKKIELMNPQEVYDALEEKNALNIKLEDDEVVTLKKEDLLFEKTFSIHGKQVDVLKVDNALIAIAK
jgi:valyl-tRNA synthetase